MVLGGNMSGKGAKGLLMGKSSALVNKNNSKHKDKKKPVSRSSRAGLQVSSWFFHSPVDFHIVWTSFLDLWRFF